MILPKRKLVEISVAAVAGLLGFVTFVSVAADAGAWSAESPAGLISWLSPTWLALISGVFAAAGALLALRQILPSSVGASDVRAERKITNEAVAYVTRQIAEEGQRAEVVQQETLSLLRQLTEQLRHDGLPDPQIRSFSETAAELAQSTETFDKLIAEEIVRGDPISAADRLMREVEAARGRNAERMRQAARIYAPFAPSKAMAAYVEVVDLDPADVWSWIELGRLRAAYESMESARRVFEIAGQHASNPSELGVLHVERGNLAFAEGDLGAARQQYEAALSVAEQLAKREPSDPRWQRNLVVSFERLGQVEVALGNLDAARERSEAGIAIAERLAQEEPGNAQWQRALALSYERLGDVERASGNLLAARKLSEAGLAISERLAMQEPANIQWQSDLSVSFRRLGDVEIALGSLDAARERYEAGLAIAERLVMYEPGNTQWQRDLSVSYERLGNIEITSGDLDAARQRYEADLAIAERLAAQEPGNAEWQRDFFVSNVKLGRLAEMVEDRAEAALRFEAAEAIATTLVARWPDHPQFARDLEHVRAELAKLNRS